MINIDYTFEEVLGEPGPNLVWHGRPIDFKEHVLPLIDSLLKSNDSSIKITDNTEGFKLNECSKVILSKRCNGNFLTKIIDKNISISLPHDVWSKILEIFSNISRTSCHDYIEFDELDNLIEDANWIVASDFSNST